MAILLQSQVADFQFMDGMSRPSATLSSLEKLPSEILLNILQSFRPKTEPSYSRHLRSLLPVDVNNNDPSFNEGNWKTLMSLVLASKKLNSIAQPILHSNFIFFTHHFLTSFAAHVRENQQFGELVDVFDLSAFYRHFRQNDRVEIQKAVGELVAETLEFMPNIQDLSCAFQDSKISLSIVKRILEGKFPRLRSLEWTPKMDPDVLALMVDFNPSSATPTSIAELKMHDYIGDNEEEAAIQNLLSLMPRLKSLEFSANDAGRLLPYIPNSAKLACLVMNMRLFPWDELTEFIKERPTLTSSLVTLDLGGHDWSATWNGPSNLNKLFDTLPRSLRSLSITGAELDPGHVQHLQVLCGHLEELAIGSGLRMVDIEDMMLPSFVTVEQAVTELGEDTDMDIAESDIKRGGIMDTMNQAVAICNLRAKLNSAPDPPPPSSSSSSFKSALRYLDIRRMTMKEQRNLQHSLLLGKLSRPLEIIEFTEGVYLNNRSLSDIFGAVGWRLTCRYKRCWIERKR